MIGEEPTDFQVVDRLNGSSIFLYMESCDDGVNLCKLNPSWLAQCVNRICGEVLQIKPLRGGRLLIEVADTAQAVQLVESLTCLPGSSRFPVEVCLAHRLNEMS